MSALEVPKLQQRSFATAKESKPLFDALVKADASDLMGDAKMVTQISRNAVDYAKRKTPFTQSHAVDPHRSVKGRYAAEVALDSAVTDGMSFYSGLLVGNEDQDRALLEHPSSTAVLAILSLQSSGGLARMVRQRETKQWYWREGDEVKLSDMARIQLELQALKKAEPRGCPFADVRDYVAVAKKSGELAIEAKSRGMPQGWFDKIGRVLQLQ